MQDFPTSANPLRVVVQLSGDTVQAVHSGLPVQVLFASYEPDAIDEHCNGFTDLDGKSVALWMDGSEGHPTEAPIVGHLFGQYCQTGSLSDLDRESIKGQVAGMNGHQQALHQLAMALRGPGQLSQAQRDRLAQHIETLSMLHGMLSDHEWTSDLYQCVANLLTHQGLPLYPIDSELDPQQLADKYGTATSWGEHPRQRRAFWREEVASEDTQSGYWEWVYNRIQNGDDDE